MSAAMAYRVKGPAVLLLLWLQGLYGHLQQQWQHQQQYATHLPSQCLGTTPTHAVTTLGAQRHKATRTRHTQVGCSHTTTILAQRVRVGSQGPAHACTRRRTCACTHNGGHAHGHDSTHAHAPTESDMLAMCTSQYSTVTGDRVPTPALASEPSAHEGA